MKYSIYLNILHCIYSTVCFEYMNNYKFFLFNQENQEWTSTRFLMRLESSGGSEHLSNFVVRVIFSQWLL